MSDVKGENYPGKKGLDERSLSKTLTTSRLTHTVLLQMLLGSLNLFQRNELESRVNVIPGTSLPPFLKSADNLANKASHDAVGFDCDECLFGRHFGCLGNYLRGIEEICELECLDGGDES